MLTYNAGDIIAFEIDKDIIKLRKASPIDIKKVLPECTCAHS